MEPQIMKNIANIARILGLLFLFGCFGTLAKAQPEGNVADAMSYRDFIRSLTPAERKIPIDVVAAVRFAEGESLPTSLNELAALQATAERQGLEVFRIDGSSVEELVAALTEEGVSPRFVSPARNYVTALMTPSSIIALAERNTVFKISVVRGPSAQGQGTTQAAGAHRLGDLYPADKPGAGDPALDGSGVVIGLISLPFSQADLNVLQAEDPLIVPRAPALHVRAGAIDNANGSLDALYLLQLIHDIAPAAQVVMASPGFSSTPGEMAAVIDALVEGDSDEDIPAAHVIIDDLFYPDQNPFEVDEVSEAIAASRQQNVLYITAAGDNGQGGESATSAVYLADFEGIRAPSELVAIDPFLDGYFVQSFGGDGYISVTEDLDSLCIFWSERPSPASIPRFVAWIYDPNNTLVGDIGVSAPGGCTGTPVATGSKVVFDQGASAVTNYRLMVTGVRSVVPSTLRFSGPIFDTVTPGSIRGHAASEDALTIAASTLCADGEAIAYSTCSSPLSVASYSSDGEEAGTARFFWESDGAGGYAELAGGIAVSKPDLTAAGQSILEKVSSGATEATNFYGTSASAAVTAGISALYWQYARETLGTRTDFIDDMTSYLLQKSTLNLGDSGRDILSGFGVIDAPKPVELGIGAPGGPVPLLRVTLTAKSAGALLQFQALAAEGSGASYSAVCTAAGSPISGWTDQPVEPDQTYALQATPEAVVRCTVTGSITEDGGDVLSASDSAAVVANQVAETVVSFSSGADEVSVAFSPDANIVDEGMLSVTLTCTSLTSGETLIDGVELVRSPYTIEIDESEVLECSVTTMLSINGGAASPVGDPVTETVTVDVAASLPIWLLYKASQ